MEALNKELIDSGVTEQELIRLIINGRKELFEVLMRQNNQVLYRIIKGYISADNDVEDIMQDTFILAYQNLSQFKGNSKFSTWLIRIGINEALRYINSLKKEGNMNIKDENIEERLSYDPITPEIKVIRLEAKNSIEKAIDELPARLRTVFIMREIEGLDAKTVAECLDLTIVNVKVRFHRAKKMLQEKLYKYSDMSQVYAYGNEHCDHMVHNVMDAINNL